MLLSGFFSIKTSIDFSSLPFVMWASHRDFERLSSLKKPLILAIVGSLNIAKKCYRSCLSAVFWNAFFFTIVDLRIRMSASTFLGVIGPRAFSSM